ncbi:MAG: hypothetical protein JXB39_13035 [Deltaproteobacteria bacterium]|nr:hypothetical protein [Deltaproteobacteria bacterium]
MTLPRLRCLLAAAGLLSACSRGDPVEGDLRDAVFIGIPDDVPSLLPVRSRAPSDAWILDTVTWPLLWATVDGELSWEPALAESWSLAPDGRTVHLALRPGVTWEDGAPVTSRDVAFSFDLAADPAVGSRLADGLRAIDPLARPAVVSDLDVAFRFLSPRPLQAALAVLASVPVLPHHVLGQANRAALAHHYANGRPLVCGPWRVSRWRPGDRLVLEANRRFTGPKEDAAHLTHVVFRVLPEYDARLDALESGAVDVVRDLRVEDADRLVRTRPEIALRRRGWRTLAYVGWNLEVPLFADPGVRRALTTAVNRDGLVDTLLTSRATGDRYGRPAVGSVTPALGGAHADEIVPIPYDPVAARTALAEAGWIDRNDDGVLDREGRPFRFHLLLPSGLQTRGEVAARVRADLQEVGVDAVLDSVSPTIFQERLRDRDFQAVLGAWSTSLPLDLSAHWHSKAAGTLNFVSYANSEVDALLDAASSEADPERERAAWRRLQVLIYQDQPCTFLYWADEIVAVHRRFRDTRVDLASPWGRLERWWVPPEAVRDPSQAEGDP